MGYKTEQFVGKVDDHLICVLCQEVLQDPWGCKDGHAFCKECITVWLKTNQKCPLDNKPLQANNLVHNLIVKNMIDNLDVYCHPPENDRRTAAWKERCDWTGKLQSLAKHRETCPFQEVQCPHVNCNKMIQRRELEYHDEVCLFKRVMCEDCSFVLIRRELEKHRKDNCPEAMILCPNRCSSGKGLNTRIKRMHLNHHLTNICAKAVLDCPYKDQGCSVQVERQDVEKHVQENMAAHMMLLAKQCSSLTKENQLLKDELKEVKEKEELSRSYVWRFDYRSLSKADGVSYRSPTFWLCGYSWYLVMYPNGKDDAKGFISVYLEQNKEYGSNTSVHFSLRNSDISVSCRLSVMKGSSFDNDASAEKNFVFNENEGSPFSSLRYWKGWPRFLEADSDVISTYCDSRGYLNVKCTIKVKEMERRRETPTWRRRTRWQYLLRVFTGE